MKDFYYQEQLQNLRKLAREFSQANPAVAPFLSTESNDPDVERLLEGVAFLTGLVRAKVDDEIPELIHSLTNIIFPHYLRPIPSMAIVAFKPKPSLMEPTLIPKGTSLASQPVEEESCRFRTSFNVEIHPLTLRDTRFQFRQLGGSSIDLEFELANLTLEQWRPRQFLLYLGGSFSAATELLFHLTRNLKAIHLEPVDKGESLTLEARALEPFGFEEAQGLLPYPRRSFPGFRLLQEYFSLPQKFLFLQLTGWERWQNRGAGQRFRIRFELASNLEDHPLPALRDDSFILGAVPVVNLFKIDSEPIALDIAQPRVRLNPSQRNPLGFSVFSVDKVVGLTRGTVEHRSYRALEEFGDEWGEDPVYQVVKRYSPVHGGVETLLAFSYPGQSALRPDETLSVNLTCTNRNLPERLQLGDICRETESSPGLLTFANITSPTPQSDPPIGHENLWKLLSHLALNFLSLGEIKGLQTLLETYLHLQDRDRQKVTAMRKRVQGLVALNIETLDQIVNGMMMRGQKIVLTIRRDHFSSDGDLCLFGSVLDRFFAEYSAMNCFTQLLLREADSKEEYLWPARLGNRQLL